MEKRDCDVCLSAGSVNQWGVCEICGEDLEEDEALLIEIGGTTLVAADDEEAPAVSPAG